MSKIYPSSNYVNDVFLADTPKEHAIFLSQYRTTKNSVLQVLGECPICHAQRWITKANVDNGHTKSTYCFAHRNFWMIRWVPLGAFDGEPNIIVDYAQQKASESAANSGKRVVFIFSTCPGCHESRWVRAHGLKTGLTTFCMSCAKKHAPHTKSAGGITVANGYTYVHIETLAERYTPDEMCLIQTHIRSSKERYFPEHRVVALMKYGPLFFSQDERIVVRHVNGKKRDNRPENLILGSQGDNINDHVTDRRLATTWRNTAVELAKIVQLLLIRK